MTNKEIKEMAQDEILAQISAVLFSERQERARLNGFNELTEEEANAVTEQIAIQTKRIATQLFGYQQYELQD